MRKIVVAAVLAGTLAIPVHAQQRGGGEGPSAEEIAEKREKEALDRQYKNALKNVQGQESQKKNDPWASMRAPSTSGR